MKLKNYMGKAILFAIMISSFNLVTMQTHAQDGWATVDSRILLMLHPQMKNFDYSNGRFFREQLSKKDINKVMNELKAAREKAQSESKSVKDQQQQLFLKRFELIKQKTRAKGLLAPGDLERLQKEKTTLEGAMQELLRQKPTNRDAERLFAARKVDLNDRLSIIDQKINGQGDSKTNQEIGKNFQLKIDEIDQQIIELGDKVRKIEENSVSTIYLNSEETEKRLTAIKEEIRELIKKAAEESKIATVMDTSFAMRSPVRKDKMKMIPAVDESPDVVSSSLFHSFDNLTIDPKLQASLKGPEGEPLPAEHLVVGRSLGMQSNLTQYLEFRNYMPEKVADFSHGRLFLSGGTDLTPWVARQLFDRYKIPESVKNSFMLALRNYLNFDKEPVIRERDY